MTHPLVIAMELVLAYYLIGWLCIMVFGQQMTAVMAEARRTNIDDVERSVKLAFLVAWPFMLLFIGAGLIYQLIVRARGGPSA